MLPSNRTYAFWLALTRIVVGVLWILHALPKFTNPDRFLPPNGFIVTMIGNAVNGSPGMPNMPAMLSRPPVGEPYHSFLANVVMPNIGIFAELVRVGELLVGISLVLGLFTRLGGLGGMFLTLNYMLAQSTLFSAAGWGGPDGAYFILSAINLVLPTGRMIGFDAFMGGKKVVVVHDALVAQPTATPAPPPPVVSPPPPPPPVTPPSPQI